MSTDEAEDAYLAFVHAHAPALTRVAYQLTHDREGAADLVQDALLKVWVRWDRVRGVAAPYPYVRRVLVTTHLNATRRRPRTQAWSADADVTGDADPSASVADRDAVWRALGDLPERQRAVLVLRHYEGCDDGEIAAVLGCRRATVRSLAARAAAILRPVLAEHHHPRQEGDRR